MATAPTASLLTEEPDIRGYSSPEQKYLLQIMATFLQQHGTQETAHRIIRTDQGGELWASQDFRKLALGAGYLLEPTGSGAPFQNGLAERPNQTFGQMVRCLLHSSGLGPEYWSYALTHAAYLKNRLPHTAIQTTPYEAYTGLRPSATHHRVFGCPVTIKNPGKRPTKLDLNTSTGRFLGYTATDRNIYYLDNNTRRLKIATHCVFDEAGMTLPPAEHAPAIQALQKAGMPSTPASPVLNSRDPTPDLTGNPAKDHPTQDANTTDQPAYHPPAQPPANQPGIPPATPATDHPPVHPCTTPQAANPACHTPASPSDPQQVTSGIHTDCPGGCPIRTQQPISTAETPAATPLPDLPYDIHLSQDPFDQLLPTDIAVKGDHPVLGLNCTQCKHRHRLRLIDMVISTPASRIPRWRSTLCNAYIISVQGNQIYNMEDLQHHISHARKEGQLKVQVVFATDNSFGIHPQEGIPQLYFDQLNIIAKHLQAAQVPATVHTTSAINDPVQTPPPAPNPTTPTPAPDMETPDPDKGKSFKLRELKQRPDWPLWRTSKFTMLDQYHSQGMFSAPQPLPTGANALHMLWTYIMKMCSTRKSRLVCNGHPRQKGTVTLGHTYANALDAASERLFWSIVANEGMIAIGADVTNAFAEAPPPKAPLYLYIDEAFREWWSDHLGNPPIPPECNVVRVHNAIQGHPESPRLW